MRVRWRDFELPSTVVCEEATRTPSYGKFLIEPFERGFGITVGNSLRRVLLSSLEGAAVTWIKIEGVQHEFSAIRGVYEDVTDICLNVKGLLLRIFEGEEVEIRAERKEKGVVRAGELQCPPHVEILNPELVIATLTEDVPFEFSLGARRGRAYVTAEENARGEHEIGIVYVDSCFSPVSRVRSRIENTRVGQVTNYDRLILEIWTNGTVSPEMALVQASKILRKHLNPFVQYSSEGYLKQPNALVGEEELEARGPGFDERLAIPVAELDLSARSANCLQADGIRTVGDLVQRTESQLLKLRNFGKTSLDEVKQKLADLGLPLGADPSSAEEDDKEVGCDTEKAQSI